MSNLGVTNSFAFDINNARLIAGMAGNRAVIWDGGQMKDLNTLIEAGSGWVLTSANAINESGQIAGTGTFNGRQRAFLLTPGAYYWNKPAGGQWNLADNWDP